MGFISRKLENTLSQTMENLNMTFSHGDSKQKIKLNKKNIKSAKANLNLRENKM